MLVLYFNFLAILLNGKYTSMEEGSRQMRKKRTIEVNIGDFGGLSEALEHILGDIVGEAEEKSRGKIPIGIISNDLRQEYLAWKDSKDDFDYEMKMQRDRLERKVMRELTNLFEERFYEMQRAKEKLWLDIRKELNITDDVGLNIDTKTGVISQWVETHEHKH